MVSNNDLLKEIRAMAAKFDKANERMDNMQQLHENNISDINEKIIQIHSSTNVDIAELRNNTNNAITKILERIDSLENDKKIMDKVNDLIIIGIPYSMDENLRATVSNISVVINYEENDSIISAVRFKSLRPESNVVDNNATKVAPIILKFKTTPSRRTFHAKYFAFCKTDALKLSHIGIDCNNRIYINENLSKTNLDLLKKAKKLKKSGKIAGAYSYDGKVCVYHQKSDKKFEIISNVEDLNKFN